MAKRRIGLLGGSFNPAHAGHRYISVQALRRLALDEVWWMVSPQNPLKPATGMAPFEERMAQAATVADHPRIRVTDVERRLGTVYTADTLQALVPRFAQCRFVWLMGADNLDQVWEWKDWQRIFAAIPIAVFARPPYSPRILSGKAAKRFASRRIAETRARHLADMQAPAWVFFHNRPHTGSATRIRAFRAAEAALPAPSSAPSGVPDPLPAPQSATA
ncbi:MAG: nicotinate-nucleotide adenylyltransferase [Rhodospirillales bacterium]